MENKIVSNVLAGLLVVGSIGVASAQTYTPRSYDYNHIDLLFTNVVGESVNYTFSAYLDVKGGAVADFDSVSYDIGELVITYSSSDYRLSLGPASNISTFGVYEKGSFGTSNPITSMSFNWYIAVNPASGFVDIVEAELRNGDMYTGNNFVISNTPYLLNGQYGSVEMTDLQVTTEFVSAVPVPAAVWLFGSGLIGLAGIARRKA